ncbi:MAG: hypothetical protein WKF66_16955 [Pedobacter sp.]
MKDIKIGVLTFKPRALRKIAMCLFFNGVLIGLMVAYKKYTGNPLNFFIIYPLLFLPFLLNRKEICKNVFEDLEQENP